MNQDEINACIILLTARHRYQLDLMPGFSTVVSYIFVCIIIFGQLGTPFSPRPPLRVPSWNANMAKRRGRSGSSG